jgi:hypothetical protein
VSAADPNSSVTVPMSALDQKQTLAMIGPWANRAVDSEKCFFNRKPTRECKIMPTYVSLVQFTDQGIRAAKDTTHRWPTGPPR